MLTVTYLCYFCSFCLIHNDDAEAQLKEDTKKNKRKRKQIFKFLEKFHKTLIRRSRRNEIKTSFELFRSEMNIFNINSDIELFVDVVAYIWFFSPLKDDTFASL